MTNPTSESAKPAKPPKHKYWGAGEVDCPRDIKAGNGELHSLRCKVCGKTNPPDEFCWNAAPPTQTADARDAARWREARKFLAVEDVQNWYSDEWRGHQPNEFESAKADALVDAAIAAIQREKGSK